VIKEGDWVIYQERPGSEKVLAAVDQVNGAAYHLSVIRDGELHPFAIAGTRRVSLAPIETDPDPFLIDLALSTRDKKWFKTLRGTK
jgi:hypothetical protein